MAAYRFYCLDGTGGISFAEWIEARDDTDAIQQARSLTQGALKCEVWREERLVAILEKSDLAAVRRRAA